MTVPTDSTLFSPEPPVALAFQAPQSADSFHQAPLKAGFQALGWVGMATAPLQPARGQRLRSASVGANTLSPEKLPEGIDEGKGRLKIKNGHVCFEIKGEPWTQRPSDSPALEGEGAWMGWIEGGYLVASFPYTSNSCELLVLIVFVLTGSLSLNICIGHWLSSIPTTACYLYLGCFCRHLHQRLSWLQQTFRLNLHPPCFVPLLFSWYR